MKPVLNLPQRILAYSHALQKESPSDHTIMTLWGRNHLIPSNLPHLFPGDNSNVIPSKDFKKIVTNNMRNSLLLFEYMFEQTFSFASQSVKIEPGDNRAFLQLLEDPRLLHSTSTYVASEMKSQIDYEPYVSSVFQTLLQNTPKENALAFLSAAQAHFSEFIEYIDKQQWSLEQAVHVAIRTGACFSIFISAIKSEVERRE